MAYLTATNLTGANLGGVILWHANLQGANLSGADLTSANLSGAILDGTNLTGANLSGVDLTYASMHSTNLIDTNLTGCHIHGISAWGLKISEGTKQQDLIITSQNEPEITTDNVEVAQFIYLLINNEKIRKVIETITSKMVLILGRFSAQRKVILDAIRDDLRRRNLMPVIFDFPVPRSRNVTETVKVLAGLARFVITDITDATEVRVELHTVVPLFPSLPVQPILLRGQPEFVSMSDLAGRVLPMFEYDSKEHLLANLDKSVVGPAEAKALELQRPKQG